MRRRILVPLDGTHFSEAALAPAAALARRTGATLLLATVEAPRTTDATPPWMIPHDPFAWIDARARKMGALGVAAEATVLHGGVCEELVDFGSREAVDLAVMTTHGRGALSRAWLGSVTDRMVREAPFPVLAVRPAEASPAPADVIPFPRKVLVALDGSALSESVLPRVLEWLGRDEAEIALVEIVLPLEAVVPAYVPDSAQFGRELGEARQSEAEAYLHTVARGLVAQGWSARTEVRSARQPAMGILAFAHAWGADVLALATHGRSGIARAVLGSVADKVLRSADRPVFLLHPEAAVPDELTRRASQDRVAVL